MVVQAALQTIFSLALILTLGLVVTFIASKFKTANVLLLLVAGLVMSYLHSINLFNFTFSEMFIVTIALFTLIIVVFEGTSKFSLRMVDSYSGRSLKLFLLFLLLSLGILTPLVSFLFYQDISLTPLLLSSIFVVTLVGTDPTSLFHIVKNSTNKVIQLLEIESVINTPFTVILPLIVFEILSVQSSDISQVVLGQVSPLLLQIVAGIGLGVLVGYTVPHVLKKIKNKSLEPAFLLAAILLCYIIAEYIGGSGVLAVATTGLFFGNIYLREKQELQSFVTVLSNIFVILVFVLVGFAVKLDVTGLFLLKSAGVFAVAILLRYVVLSITLPLNKFLSKERWFMALMLPKGVAVAVVVLSLSVFTLTGFTTHIATLVQLIVVCMILSLLIATIVGHFDGYFLKRIHNEQQRLKKEQEQLERKKKLLEKEIKSDKKKLQKAKTATVKKSSSVKKRSSKKK
ncbi:MAG: cation:proton antiporter [Candidatus Nanoarchaeia archaeon]